MVETLDISKLYVEHSRLLDSRADAYSSMYKTDFSDARSEASEIFCKVVENYDPDLGKFSTVLYSELQRLSDSIRKDLKRDVVTENADDTESFPDGLEMPSYKYDGDSELMFSAREYLEEDALAVLDGIFSGTFEAVKAYDSQVPGLALIELYIKEHWNWKRSRVLRALNQIKKWLHEEVM